MRTLLEAAEKGERVTCNIVFIEEFISKKGNPTLKIGMKCRDNFNINLDGWLVQYISPNANWFAQQFYNALSKPVNILYEGDVWLYNESDLKGNTAECVLKAEEFNGNHYPKPDKWIAVEKIESTTISNNDPFVDDDIPF